ncbi:retrovirus-related pol polyprotein from transposon TNT 1-94 [Tanacetum coccineum]
MSTSKTSSTSLLMPVLKIGLPMLERVVILPWASVDSDNIKPKRRQNRKWEALVSVYNRFAQLMNDLERNNMNFPTVTINTKFLNSLQPEWLKYVTQVRLAKRLTVDSFDDLFDYLQQFKKLVNTSRAKKLKKSHDPLALVAHMGSSSRQTSSYYVTHPTSVVDYDDEYQQDDVHNNSEDPLVSTMLLLAKAITQNFSNPTNNHLRASSNTRNQAIIQGDRVNIQSRNSSNTGRNNRRAYVQEEVVEGMNAQNETGNVQRTLRTPSSVNTSTVQCYKLSGKRVSEDILEDAFKNQVKPIVNELQFYFEFFKTLFQRDIKEMKDVFESTESELCELEKQNDFLKDQLLEVSLKHEVELSVLLNHECVDNSLHAEIEQIKKKSIEIQEGLQARIKILEKDVQRCEKQSVDFELKLQHEKEKHKWDSILKNKNTNPLDYSWISKMEKLEDENVSLDFKVQSLIKERDNVKLEYQKLFNSIKKTRSQTQKEMDELIAHVSEKTYAYGAIRAENQNLLFTISELKTRLENIAKGKSVNTKFDKTNGSQTLLCVTPLNKHVFHKTTDVPKSEENHVVSKPVTLQTSPAKQRGANSNKNVIAPGMYKVVTTHESQTNETKHGLSSTGMNAASSVRRPMNRDSHVKNSVLANSKKSAKKVAVYVRKNKQTDNTFENVISNKENVIDIEMLLKRKLCYVFLVCKMFSEKSALSKSLDTTSVVSKPKIDVGSASQAKNKVVQIVLWVVDSGCSKHMTGDRSLLRNFIEKFMGTVRFGNDNFEAITGYGDYIHGNITIYHVYYVEVLGHNLFSVGQFYDGDLEVAFRSKTCYVRNLKGDDLLTSGRESNLYTISISDMAASSPVCLMSKSTSTKSWLWHCRLSHLNFGTINDLTRLDLVDGLPKFKYEKDHLCSAMKGEKARKPLIHQN